MIKENRLGKHTITVIAPKSCTSSEDSSRGDNLSRLSRRSHMAHQLDDKVDETAAKQL